MSLSTYAVLTPPLTRSLRALKACLEKGEAFAEKAGRDSAWLVEARIAPDMHPLARQIQIATDMAKFGAARLSRRQAPSFPDVETTFEELKARIDRAISYMEEIPEADYEGAETLEITLSTGSGEMTLSGEAYLLNFVLPNFYFHMTTAYDILRKEGVPLGKRDFLGG